MDPNLLEKAVAAVEKRITNFCSNVAKKWKNKVWQDDDRTNMTRMTPTKGKKNSAKVVTVAAWAKAQARDPDWNGKFEIPELLFDHAPAVAAIEASPFYNNITDAQLAELEDLLATACNESKK